MAIHSNATQPGDDKTFSKEPPVDDLLATSHGRSAPFANALTSFAEALAPRRRVIRDPYYGAAARQHEVPSEANHHFTAPEWVMIVVAGIALGVVFTLMFAGI